MVVGKDETALSLRNLLSCCRYRCRRQIHVAKATCGGAKHALTAAKLLKILLEEGEGWGGSSQARQEDPCCSRMQCHTPVKRFTRYRFQNLLHASNETTWQQFFPFGGYTAVPSVRQGPCVAQNGSFEVHSQNLSQRQLSARRCRAIDRFWEAFWTLLAVQAPTQIDLAWDEAASSLSWMQHVCVRADCVRILWIVSSEHTSFLRTTQLSPPLPCVCCSAKRISWVNRNT